MKKIFYSIFAIAALAACTKPGAIEQAAAFRIEVLTNNSTKPTFNQDTYKVSWKTDEVLHVLINDQAYSFSKTTDSDYSFECAEFQPVEGQTYNWEIVTPYRSDYGERTFSFSGGIGPVMYGVGTTTGAEVPSIQMELLNSIVRLEIENTGDTDITINQYRFESDTDAFGGRRTIVDGEVVLKEGIDPVKYTAITSGNDITIKAGEKGYKCLQCGPFTATEGSKLKVTLTAGSDIYTKEIEVTAENPVEFKAGKVKTTHINIAKEAPVPTGDTKVYVDFGTNTVNVEGWNSVSAPAVSAEPVALLNGDGEDSGLTLAITSAFSTTFGGAGSEPLATFTAGGIDFPKDVYKDALQISDDSTTGKIEIAGCEAGATYKVKVLSIRYNGSREIRVSKIDVNGANTTIDTGAKSANDMNNNNFIAEFDSVTPDANGKIQVSVSAVVATRTDVVNGFINALVIEKE